MQPRAEAQHQQQPAARTRQAPHTTLLPAWRPLQPQAQLPLVPLVAQPVHQRVPEARQLHPAQQEHSRQWAWPQPHSPLHGNARLRRALLERHRQGQPPLQVQALNRTQLQAQAAPGRQPEERPLQWPLSPPPAPGQPPRQRQPTGHVPPVARPARASAGFGATPVLRRLVAPVVGCHQQPCRSRSTQTQARSDGSEVA